MSTEEKQQVNSSSLVKGCEIRIPVPWGHIAGKTWGDPCNFPMLGVHGVQDNAATFDKLVPLLPPHFYLVSIDLPGHGHSSHLPPGMYYSFMDWVTAIKRVVDHFKWDKIYYLGHSLGAMIGSYFAALYPEHVVKLVMLDTLKPVGLSPRNYVSRFKVLNTRLLNLENKLSEESAPFYSYEEALGRQISGRNSLLTDDSAKTLLSRSITKGSSGYKFLQDQRIKVNFTPNLPDEQQLIIFKHVKCELLIVQAEESGYLLSIKGYPETLKTFKEVCPYFEHVVVEGNHDVHLNHPERVAPVVSRFLLYQKSSL